MSAAFSMKSRDFLARVQQIRDLEQDQAVEIDEVTSSKKDKPTLEAMKRDTPAGCCIACDGPLPKGKRYLCGSDDCWEVYRIVWYADRNRNRRHVAGDAAPNRAIGSDRVRHRLTGEEAGADGVASAEAP